MARAPRIADQVAAARGWLGRHGHLVVVAGALLVLTRAVDFAPPEQVRPAPAPPEVASPSGGGAAGLPPPSAELRGSMSTAQAVQVRATLRAIEDPEAARLGAAEVPSRVLAQPLVATMIGIPATIDQKVRVDDGALEVVIAVTVTPRAEREGLRLEEEVRVVSRRRADGDLVERLCLVSAGEVVGVEARGRRWVFAVEDRLFSLDLDVQRAAAG